MRKSRCLALILFLLLSFVIAVPSALAQTESDSFYFADGKKIILPLSKEKIAVRFKKGMAESAVSQKLAADPMLRKLSLGDTLPPFNLTILDAKQEKLEQQMLRKKIKHLRGLDYVETAYPVFEFTDSELIATDELVVKLKQGYDLTDLKKLNKTFNTEIVKKNKWLKETYILRIKSKSVENSVDIANFYHQNPIVEFSHPNFIRVLSELAAPNDTLFADQWALDNTGQSGWQADADIDALEAWNLAGQNEVVIAIIDEGVDVDHIDLEANIVPGYDDTGQSPPGGIPGNADNNAPHGTSCAGIAAAVSNNSEGIAGVSRSAKIMPVRVATVSTHGGWITTDGMLAQGILWAAYNGADILSNSWGSYGGSPPSEVVHYAITEASEHGRNGLGSVIVFASGNDNLPVVNWPAYYEEVIAVGASSPCDERKSPSSCDGDNWGSNYGPELDVVAPGVRLTTTDIMGSGGYTSGNYLDNFGGTSGATPHVAGLAALILSVDPQLTVEQVKSVIYSTAEDGVGPPSEDTPGWDQFMGWGRVNAYEALKSLCSDKGKIQMNQTEYGPGSEIIINVWDNHLNSDPAQIEQYSDIVTITTSEGDLETNIILSENDPDSCHFTGTISIETAVISPEDGAVQIACSSGEVITAQYSDADDGTGNPATPSDTAAADCEAPVISSVSASGGYYDATITWNTDELSDSKVFYGTSPPLTANASSQALVTNHSILLDGLTPDTTYYYAVESTDEFGNTSLDDNNGQYYQFNTMSKIVYYVPDDYPTIQSAIDAIPSYPENEIIVRAGTYTENIDSLGKDFKLRSESGPDVTILDGGNAGSVMTLGHTGIYGQLIEGFTITNGNNYAGGGIFAMGVGPKIVNCKITGNTATSSGGGIYNPYFSPEIIDSEITNNSSGEVGGGIYFAHPPSAPTIINTIIANNTAAEYGGGIYGNEIVAISIEGSTIISNTANKGGGVYLYLPDFSYTPEAVQFTNSSVSNNSVTGVNNAGGGIYLQGSPSSVTISNCSINNNVADQDGQGGGFYMLGSNDPNPPYTIVNSTFNGNMAGYGGAINFNNPDYIIESSLITNNSASIDGGGIWSRYLSYTLVNCIVTNNSAQNNGGGMFDWPLSYTTSYILNSTFSDNAAGTGAWAWGGAIYYNGSSLTDLNIVNSIFWGDTANGNPNEVYGPGTGYFTYSIKQGDHLQLNGNLNVDPQFAGGGDYHLSEYSPAIDSGTSDTTSYPDLPDHDIAGDMRPNGLSHDMGAYEYSCSSSPDTDGDGSPDCYDPDNDNDGMPDDYELNYGLNPNDPSDAVYDDDNDGLTNVEEYISGTDPQNFDTDGDGVPDGYDEDPLDDQLSQCLYPPIQNEYSLKTFTTIQAAVNDPDAVDNDIIQIMAADFGVDLIYDRSIILTLSGGYYCGFSDNPYTSSVNSLTISNGTAIVENIVIQSPP